MDLYHVLCYFFLYAFLGWCAEVSFAALNTGRFVNRGFLNGPVCPIYGCGVVVVLLVLEPLRENSLLLFLGAMALTSLLEWLTGLVLEKLFHQRWWDYSDEPFNLSGYICLRFSVMWGLACLLVVEVVHPTAAFLVGLLPRSAGWVILGILGAVTLCDLAATVRTIARINRQLGQVDELAGRIRTLSDELGGSLADRVLDAAQRGVELRENLEELRTNLSDLREDLSRRTEELLDSLEEWKDSFSLRGQQQLSELKQLRQKLIETQNRDFFGRRRLLRAFPSMRSVDHKQALERLKQRLSR